jgi:MoaA/NifB/PqqE/SkfB family radical SAM enzyme
MGFTKETFCTMPWSSILILPSGDFKICCFTGHKIAGGGDSHGIAVNENMEVMNVLTHSIKDAMNSVWHKEIRASQAKGERHEACKVCWDRDDAASRQNVRSTSLRVVRTYDQNIEGAARYNPERNRVGGQPMIGSAIPENAAQWLADAQTGEMKDIMPVSLDIRFSNLCNAKCIMCEPLYSTRWYEDHELVTGQSSFSTGPKRYNIFKEQKVSGGYTYSSDMPEWRDDPRWWKQLDELAPHLRHIYITGGEPFIQPMHDKFIERLAEGGYAKNIVIEYDTNLSVINPKIFKLLTEFKDIILRISTDDVGPQYELIRHPLKFDTLLDNMNKLKEYGLDKKIDTITTCIGIYSMYAPMRMYETFGPMGYDKYFIRILRSPHAVDMAYLPRSIKEKVIRDYDGNNALPHFHKTHIAGYLKNNLDLVTDAEANIHLARFVRYMESLDKVRGTDWKSTFPEIVKLIADYYAGK